MCTRVPLVDSDSASTHHSSSVRYRHYGGVKFMLAICWLVLALVVIMDDVGAVMLPTYESEE